jgi:hypothetical protein
MKKFAILPVMLVGLMGAGCGEGLEPEEQALEMELASQEDALKASARERQGRTESRVNVRGCWYQATARTVFPPFPPHQFLTVERLPSKRCEAASVDLEMGYRGKKPLLSTRHGELAVAWTHQPTPSGSARSQVMVFHVSPDMLSVKRTVWLGLWYGSLYASAMRFDEDHLVLDTNVGPVTLPDFLTSDAPPEGLPPPPWL